MKFGIEINSNMLNSRAMFTFSVFDRKQRFWENLVQNFKIVSLRSKLAAWLIYLCWISMGMFVCLVLDWNIFSWQIWPKNQKCFFRMKFGTWTNSNMLSSMIMFKFFLWHRKFPFWANSVQKPKIVWLRWDLVPRLIQIC